MVKAQKFFCPKGPFGLKSCQSRLEIKLRVLSTAEKPLRKRAESESPFFFLRFIVFCYSFFFFSFLLRANKGRGGGIEKDFPLPERGISPVLPPVPGRTTANLVRGRVESRERVCPYRQWIPSTTTRPRSPTTPRRPWYTSIRPAGRCMPALPLEGSSRSVQRPYSPVTSWFTERAIAEILPVCYSEHGIFYIPRPACRSQCVCRGYDRRVCS